MSLEAALERYRRGNEQLRAQALEESLESFQSVLDAHPEYWPAQLGLGVAQRLLRRDAQAIESFRRVLQQEPRHRFTLASYAESLMSLRQYSEAAQAFSRLLAEDPNYRHGPGLLIYAKLLCGDWEGFDALREQCLEGTRLGHEVAEPFALQAIAERPEILQLCARQYASRYYPPATGCLPAPPAHAEKIRVGYVSGEFRHQATSILLVEVLERHDRQRFAVTAFDNGFDDGTPLRRRLTRAVDEIVDISKMTDQAAAKAVRERDVDVLVNLNGYFGQRRQELFAMRAAPVQVNYLGFPGTIGAAYMDYIIADSVVIPETHRAFYDEKVVWLPESYQPNDRKREIASRSFSREELGLPQEGFIFCCFNNVYKLLPQMFDVWMRVLRAVEGSVLWLYEANSTAAENLKAQAERRGVDPSRIIFGAVMPLPEHLARLRLADLFLDTLPYNAHTTASDALWAGVPVLTSIGATFPGRVGASLLHAVGLPELVARDLAEYEQLAVQLGRKPGAAAALREKLARNRLSAALFDSARYTRHLEDAFALMVHRQRHGLAPDHLVIPPRPGEA